MIDDPNVKVKSLYKALKLLGFFSVETPSLGITELSKLTGMSKSSVHSIVSTFEYCGYLRKSSKTDKYSLDSKVLELSHVFSSTFDILNAIKNHLKELSEEIGEITYVGALSGKNIIYLDSCYPNDSMKEGNVVGYKAPLYCTGIGKAMLAYCNEAVIDEIINDDLTAYTDYTITDGGMLKTELQNIVNRRYSIDNMEHEFGIRCVAVSIPDKNQRHNMAISIAGPSLRMTDENIERYAHKLLEISRYFSGQY